MTKAHALPHKASPLLGEVVAKVSPSKAADVDKHMKVLQ